MQKGLLMFIARDFDRTEKDDLTLNVFPKCGRDDGAVPQYDKDGKIIGWKIKPIFE